MGGAAFPWWSWVPMMELGYHDVAALSWWSSVIMKSQEPWKPAVVRSTEERILLNQPSDAETHTEGADV